jgi:FMN phosphatase YigB (HAD superfamily)
MAIKGIIFDWSRVLYNKRTGLYEFTRPVLDELASKKYEMAIVSSANGSIIERTRQIAQSGIEHYFPNIQVVGAKTHHVYMETMRSMGLKPWNTIIIDDGVRTGIKIGNELGCLTAWILGPEPKKPEDFPASESAEANYTLKTIEPVPHILSTLR